MLRRQSGLTLIELMLVLVIGMMLLYLSVQQYYSWRRDAEVLKVNADVDALFQAMALFHKKECYGTVPGGVVAYGKLNPLNPISPVTPYPLNIKTDLRDNGYLTKAFPLNPVVDSTDPGNGYVVQFNQYTQERQMCVDANTIYMEPNYGYKCGSKRRTGTILFWKSQVAVHLSHPDLAKQYLALLGGDCLSNLSGDTVLPCAASGNTGGYVVWERMPSYTSKRTARSTYWVSSPTIKQFGQMYTTYPITSLMNRARTDDQYYLCGH